MSRIISGVLLLIGMMPPAWAFDGVVGVPAPEMGEGVIGMLLAAGAVYLIKRRG